MRIKLKRLELENFMAYTQASFDLFEKTVISGMNGIGKSTIATAYTWLMFGCDYKLKDNPSVRRIVDGVAVDDKDVSVTAVLDIDGKKVTAKKVQKRKYKKDGISHSDDNSYFINDVPKSLKAFNEYFDIDMGLLKMCSNLDAFLNQKTTDMRTYLFNLVDDVKDIDVARQNKDLAELVDLLENYTVEELQAMNKTKKSKIDKELPMIDGQIREKERDIKLKSDIDVAELELLKNTLNEQLTENQKKQTDAEALEEEIQKKTDGVLELKFQLSGLQMQANDDLNKQRNELNRSINDYQAQIDSLNSKVLHCKDGIKQNDKYIEMYQRDKEKLAEQWETVNSETFNENTIICPTCHRELPHEQIKQLMENFTSDKRQRLADIVSGGNACNVKIAECESNKENLLNDLAEASEKMEAIEKKADVLRDKLSKLPTSIDITDTEEFKKISAEISEKEADLQQSMKIDDMRRTLKIEENDIREKLSECENKISRTDTTTEERRIEELQNYRLKLEQEKTDAEKILYLLDELNKAKNEALSDEINRHFQYVKWQLFEINKSGGYKSVCIPTMGGKSILSSMSNKALQIIGKVDICNSIQRINGMSVPVFLDDAESLDNDNRMRVSYMATCQLIMLLVSDSKDQNVKISEFNVGMIER